MPHPTRRNILHNEGLPSSHGKHSRSVTPKDVSTQDASSKDVRERNLSSRKDSDNRQEELLDDAVELTFPASDPVAVTPAPQKPQKGKHNT